MSGWPVVMACVVACGCGRFGFEPLSGADGAPGDGPGDGTLMNDAPVMMTAFAASRDTFINEEQGVDLNFGAADTIRLELDQNARGLIAWDLSSIPTSAIVVGATLTVQIEVAAAGSTISYSPLLEAWTEGTADGTTGVASYSQRQVGIPWSSSGAGPPSSAGAVAGTFSGSTSGMTGTTVPAQLVQGWVSDPASNHGLLFTSSSNNTIRFVSLEGAASGEPRLVVMFQ